MGIDARSRLSELALRLVLMGCLIAALIGYGHWPAAAVTAVLTVTIETWTAVTTARRASQRATNRALAARYSTGDPS